MSCWNTEPEWSAKYFALIRQHNLSFTYNPGGMEVVHPSGRRRHITEDFMVNMHKQLKDWLDSLS